MKVEIPKHCPVCNSELELVNEQLFCRNKNCAAKTLKSILHYVKTMKIMGLGEKTLEKLNIDTVNDLYKFNENELTNILGQKIGEKLYKEIEKSKTTTLSKFLASVGIPLIGKTASEKIQTKTSKIEEINEDLCKKAGLGAKATENLMKWINEDYVNYADLPLTFEESEPVESGLVVCISGKIPGYTKSKLKELLLDYNIHVKDNVTKGIDYLITEESNTSKVKKAEQYNIHIISFENFLKEIN